MRRSLLLAFCLFCIVQELGTIVLTERNVGVNGVSPSGTHDVFQWSLALTPGSAAQRAGLRTGDVLDAASLTPAERFRLWSQSPMAGVPQRFPVRRDGNVRTIFVIPDHEPIDWALSLAIAAGFWSAICAIVLLIRRPESGAVQLLVLYLLLVRLSIQMCPANWVTPYPAADAANAALNLIAPTGWALLATYASRFARSDRVVRALAIISYALAAYLAVIGVVSVIGAWFAWVDPLGAPFVGSSYLIAQLAYLVAPLACALLVIARTRREERSRLIWLLTPTVVIYLVYQSYTTWSFLPLTQSDAFTTVALVVQLLAPLGMTYAMLNRRLLDVGFALNRAAVFAVVSTIVVGAFVLAEWAASEWLVSASHVANVIIGGLVALALGLSMRFIHKYVDRFVDRVFFRKRHEDEAALRRFAHESAYVTDRYALLQRAAGEVRDHTDAIDVAILVFDRDGAYRSYVATDGAIELGENDPAVLALRAWHKVVDLHDVSQSDLRGELAFPMVSRGVLTGILVCGAKRNGEAYAPDESSAIFALAHGVGAALDILSHRDAGSDDSLREMVTLMREQREVSAEILKELRGQGG